MSITDWTRPYVREQFGPKRHFVSTAGLHYEFVNRLSADSFYRSCIAKGNQGIVLRGTYVIDTRCRLSE